MGPPDLFNLRWNSFETNTRIVFKKLRDEREFYDVTVVADCGKQVEANKVVLSSGSSFFHKIIKENPHPHPLIYLKGVGYEHLLGILDIVYTGEASISQDDINEFLDIAQDLKVKAFEEKTGTTKQSSSTSRVPLQGVESDKEPCPSLEASQPHCVTSPISAPHKAQIAAQEAGVKSRISREAGVTSRISLEAGLSSRISRDAGLSSGISLEAGLSSRISQDAGLSSGISGEASISSKISDAHYPGEAGLSPRVSNPHCVRSSISQGQEAEEEAAPLQYLNSVPRESKVFVEELASLPRISRPPQGQMFSEEVVLSPRMPHLRSVKSAPSQGPGVADEAAPSPRMFHPHTVTSFYQSAEGAQNDTAFGVFKNGQSPPDSYEVDEENDNMIPPEEQENYIEMDNNKNNAQRMFDDMAKIMDSNTNMVVTESAKNVFIKKESAYDWGVRNEDDGNNLIPDGDQDLNEQVNSSEEKYFQCSLCTKTFNNLTNLKRHKMVHTGKKPSQLDNMNNTKRIHMELKPYQCSVCFKRFSYVKDFNKHNMVHGVKPYQCMQCSKSFSQVAILNTHKKTHTGEKPFQCSRCFNRFSKKDHLKSHMKRKKKCSANLCKY